jgi:hypothetical protein
MLVSKKIKKLRKRIKLLIDDQVEWLIIGTTFSKKTKTWSVFPMYEGAGDGHPTYLNNLFGDVGILHGNGNTLPAAIRNLEKMLDNIEKEDAGLERADL